MLKHLPGALLIGDRDIVLERIGQSVGEFELAAQELVKIADGAEQVGQQLSALKSAVGGLHRGEGRSKILTER